MSTINVFRFESQQLIPAPLDEVWNFFESTDHLLKLLPPSMGYQPVPPVPPRIEAGVILLARVRGMLGNSVPYVTEFTHAEARRFFVDEQRFGPFRFFQHRHSFQAVDKGTLMRDVVHCSLGMRPFEALLNRRVGMRMMEQVFAHRRQKLVEIFGPEPQ
jgi:ligand-binding SRPBCC domain-containing protein